MLDIEILPEEIANQIAAGEVIERPVNVVKELLENSIDAKASQIEIQFCSGGTKFIQVSDDGIGMDPANALLCFKRHATSKLKNIHDLQTLQSFGFRGEALPSIASVSQVTLITRTAENKVGTRIEIQSHHPPIQIPYPCPIGTTFTVEQLFYNVPVRRKFLKSEATESAHIIHCVRLYALAYPHVHFILKQDKHIIFSSPHCSNLLERIGEVWPKRKCKMWLPVQATRGPFSLYGVLCSPTKGCINAQEIFFFINQRPIVNIFLNNALRECYRGFLPQKLYPSAFLFIKLPEADVDINIHPTKREVRFKNELLVRRFVMDTVKNCLKSVQMQPFGITHTATPFAYSDNNPSKKGGCQDVHNLGCSSDADSASSAYSSVSKQPTFTTVQKSQAVPTISEIAPIAGTTETDLSSEAVSAETTKDYKAENADMPKQTLASLKPLPNAHTSSQEVLDKTSIISAASPKNKPELQLQFLALWQNQLAFFNDPPFLLVLDCKGAQMRIWYDHILSILKQEQIGILQTLLFPYVFLLNDLEAVCLYESIDYINLKKICSIQTLSRTQFQINAIPQWLSHEQIDLFVEQIVHSLMQYGQNQSLDQRFEPLLLKLIQKRSFERIMTQKQVEVICNALQTCENYIISPLGNPLWNRLSVQDLLK